MKIVSFFHPSVYVLQTNKGYGCQKPWHSLLESDGMMQRTGSQPEDPYLPPQEQPS